MLISPWFSISELNFAQRKKVMVVDTIMSTKEKKKKKQTILLQNSVRTSGFAVSMSFGNNALDHSLSL